ncbi:MAG: SusC/RagA family TonB-linked outer membrane protein, partial [Prevotella sp.]|nr:SusC/RagA family TonB-linked outer membrane protein [Prevotella sp.]
MKKMKNNIRYILCILCIACGISMAQAQTVTLRGRVLDASTGQPLVGALVSSDQIKGYSSLTDEEGCYEIVVPDFCSALSFSAPDFNTTLQGIGHKTTLPDVRLYPSTLKPFAAVPSSGQAAVPGASPSGVTTVVPGVSPSGTIEEEIQKQLGAQVHTIGRSGTPGIGSVMFIDGLNSLNSNAQPLIVVDGVIFDQQRDRQMLHSGFY